MIANTPPELGSGVCTNHWLEAPIGILIIVMLLSGAAGGSARYILSKVDDRKTLVQETLLGAIAAFIVPAFLSLIQSRIVTDILAVQDGKPDSGRLVNLTIVAGFCIVAAFSARQFLDNLSSRLLQQKVDDLEADRKIDKKKIDKNEERIEITADAVDDLKTDQIVSVQEPGFENVVDGSDTSNVRAVGIASTDAGDGSPTEEPSDKAEEPTKNSGTLTMRLDRTNPTNLSVIREFWSKGHSRRRSILNIARETDLEIDQVEKSVNMFANAGILIKIPATETTSGHPRYHLSGIGRRLTDRYFGLGPNTRTKLPSDPREYVTVIGENNADAMRSVMHLGQVRGGITGSGTSPYFQVTTSSGVVHRFRSINGEVRPVTGDSSYEPTNLSGVLNDELRRAGGSENTL